ncbi:glycosyltransferase family 8 protein [Roridomyces roridus]|uniref:Glycosyltransferase family 8 protein n=1 Tax=Roridomyces roridus TaxID=1738132 RepID=A0AAD7CC05_9AGAR|nr:glycosyltransferase family 8 protein [Roridomyces roridus]
MHRQLPSPTHPMSLPCFGRRLSERGSYTPLNSYPNQHHLLPGGRRQKWTSRPSKLALATIGAACAVLALVVIGKGVILRITERRYNSLDNYQNLNSMPVTVSDVHGAPHTLVNQRAVVSSLYSDGFAIAVAVLGHSVRAANVSARLVLPYLEDKVSAKALCMARAVGWEPLPVSRIPPPHDGKDIYWRFADQYTKLSIWKLDQLGVESAVYLDADTLVRANFDELFDCPFNFAAVPDIYGGRRGFSVEFNAGVLALRTSSAVYENMRQKLATADYPLGEAEQAFLNLYFGGTAMRLPYIYNANLALKKRSPVLWQRLAREMRVVHYTAVKPFLNDPSDPAGVVLSPEDIEVAMEIGERHEDGVFREEIGWWRTAYQKMLLDRGHVISQCDSS